MTKTRKILIGSVAAGALSLVLVWAIPSLAYAQGGGQTPLAPTDQDWQAMHNACTTGDWEGMNDAMQRVHGGTGGCGGGEATPGQGSQVPRGNPGIQRTQGTRAQYRGGYASDRGVGGGMMGGGMMGSYGGGYGGGMMGGYGPGSGRSIEGTGPAPDWGGMMGGGGMMGW